MLMEGNQLCHAQFLTPPTPSAFPREMEEVEGQRAASDDRIH